MVELFWAGEGRGSQSLSDGFGKGDNEGYLRCEKLQQKKGGGGVRCNKSGEREGH